MRWGAVGVFYWLSPLGKRNIFVLLQWRYRYSIMKETQEKDFYLPAEWEPQEALLLTWPHNETDWRAYLKDITETFIQLASIVCKYENVIIAARDAAAVEALLRSRIDAEAMRKITVWQADNDDTWARDHAFISLIPKQQGGESGERRLLDFRFNGWGEKFSADKDNAINATLYRHGAIKGKYIDCNDFVLEGGSIESDGQGTIFTTAHCLLAPHRNEPLGEADIDRLLRERLAADRIVWLHHGTLMGDDTDGHIDTTVRLAPNDTLLHVSFDDPNDAHYDDFRALRQELEGLRTREGKPYRLLPLPSPTAIYDGGERLPATYANFIIINGAVIVPTYGQPQSDREAMETIQRAFPDRDIIGVNALTVIRQHGSLHCLTMQIPAV